MTHDELHDQLSKHVPAENGTRASLQAMTMGLDMLMAAVTSVDPGSLSPEEQGRVLAGVIAGRAAMASALSLSASEFLHPNDGDEVKMLASVCDTFGFTEGIPSMREAAAMVRLSMMAGQVLSDDDEDEPQPARPEPGDRERDVEVWETVLGAENRSN
jgi:hypothetical protein